MTTLDEANGQAIATVRRVGPVVVDHGETGCTTAEPSAYITRVLAHREKIAARRAVERGT
jgi:hypothetical protein